VTLFGVILVNRLCGRPLGQAAQDQSSELNEADTEELGPWVIKRADNEAKHSMVFSSRKKRLTSASSNVASAKVREKRPATPR
jgi:hypothetical protein